MADLIVYNVSFESLTVGGTVLSCIKLSYDTECSEYSGPHMYR